MFDIGRMVEGEGKKRVVLFQLSKHEKVILKIVSSIIKLQIEIYSLK